MAPFPLEVLYGKPVAYTVFLLIGVAFGAVLEMSGFGNSPKLARQFYFKEMTVLKVMFMGIVVAMLLIFWATAMGWLNYNLIWVNPTYLWPGIVGGLIMGAGFIIGGFCPGTSLVAAATLKLDGIFFALGTLTGIFFFGETVQYFETFWNSSYMGRFTLPQLFGLPVGVVVLGVVIMALVMFWGAEKLEGIFGEKTQAAAPARRGPLLAGAGVLTAAAVGLLLVGQPTTADKWLRVAETRETQLADRAVQIAPAELLEYIYNDKVIVKMIDVRDEANYNVLHLVGATSAPLETVPEIIPALLTEPANTLFVVMSNDETLATEAWRTLVAESVPNAYILAGGINNWLDTFGDDGVQAAVFNATGDETLRHPFTAAVGSAHPAANPDPHAVHVEYVPKVEMKLKQGPSGGGCG